MNNRHVENGQYILSQSGRIMMSYIMPGVERLRRYILDTALNAIRARQPQQTPLALPAPPAPLLLMPAPAASPAPAKKKKRDKTDFSANVTASVSLAKKQMKAESTWTLMSSLGYVTDAVSRKIFSKSSPQQKKNIEPDTIRTDMESLETQIEGHTNPDSIILQQVELVSELIRQHAMTRVDLFFYLLVAVRGTYVTVSKDETLRQHGNGSKKAGTQACHSSLFPNVKIENNTSAAASTNWTAGLFSLANNKMKEISLKGTYFEDVLNITYELPDIVNGFDGHLEGRFQPTVYVKECVDIINKVSRNEIDVVSAMNLFFKTMNAFFTHMEYDYIKKPNKLDYPASFKRVWECEKAGTFFAANAETLTLNDNYLYMMLRINYRSERLKCATLSRFLNPYYDAIQKEILESKSEYTKSLNPS